MDRSKRGDIGSNDGMLWPVVFGISAIVLLLFLTAPVLSRNSSPAPAPAFDAGHANTLLQLLEKASGGPHPTGSQADVAEGRAIFSLLAQQGLSPQWQRGVNCTSNGLVVVSNVVVVHTAVPGRPYLLLSAHYDSAPASPGVADNLLATASLLEFARTLKQQTSNIILLFEDGEEFEQSGAHVFNAQNSPTFRIGYTINLDSLGGRGPLVVYDYGPDVAATNARLRALDGQALYSGLIRDVSHVFPNETDLPTLTTKDTPGLSAGFVLGDQAYHLPEDRTSQYDVGQIKQIGAFLGTLIPQPSAASTPSRTIAIMVAGFAVQVPIWLIAATSLLTALLIGRRLWRLSPRERGETGYALLWLLASISCALVLSFLARVALTGSAAGQPVLRLCAPVLPFATSWAILSVATSNAKISEAASILLLLCGLAALASAAGLGVVLLLAALVHVLTWALWPNQPLTPPLAAFAVLLLTLGQLVMIGAEMDQPAARLVADLGWLLLWVPFAEVFGWRRSDPRPARLVLSAALILAVASGVAALALAPAPRAPSANVDVVERLDLDLARAVLRTKMRPSTVDQAGFARGDIPVFPWSPAENGVGVKQAPCCAARSAVESMTPVADGAKLRLAADPTVVTYTIFTPKRAPISEVVLDGRCTFRYQALPSTGGYNYFTLRGGAANGHDVMFRSRQTPGVQGGYLIAERALDASLRRSLLARFADAPSDYVPDRRLTVEQIAGAGSGAGRGGG